MQHQMCYVSKNTKNMLVGWFWGALFPRTADPIFHESLCLHPIALQGYVPRPFILISLSSPEGDSIQVLQAVSFWKCGRYRLSYRGWAKKILHLFTSLGMQGRHNISKSIDKYTSRRYVPPKMVIKARFQKYSNFFPSPLSILTMQARHAKLMAAQKARSGARRVVRRT